MTDKLFTEEQVVELLKKQIKKCANYISPIDISVADAVMETEVVSTKEVGTKKDFPLL